MAARKPKSKKLVLTESQRWSSAPPDVSNLADHVKPRGFFRINIVDEDGTIAGDSGWCQNQVTNLGKKLYLCDAMGASSGSLQVGFVTLGTGGAPAATDTAIAGETLAASKRAAITYANSGSTAAVFTATFSSANSFVTASANISNIGLVNSSTSGTIFAGNTYASSSVATNQAVSISYTISFT